VKTFCCFSGYARSAALGFLCLVWLKAPDGRLTSLAAQEQGGVEKSLKNQTNFPSDQRGTDPTHTRRSLPSYS